jgi:predicted metal-dependent phosphoesterase TrpH
MRLNRRRFLVVGGTVAVAGGVLPASASESERHGPRGVWLAGDTHVHCDHSADGSLPRQQSGQRLPGNLPVRDQIGRAEQAGLDFMPLTDHRTYDQHWDPEWTSPAVLLVPGEEANGSPHAVVLGAVDTIVDGANPAGSAGFRHVQQSIWDAHAQDAVWSVAHPDNGEVGTDGRPNANASAVGPDLVEIWNPSGNPDAQIDYAENRWNLGFRYGAVAASDNHFRELWDVAGPGQFTTWVFAGDRTERAILDALRAGRTTVSRNLQGPFVTIEAELDGDVVVMGGDEVVISGRHRRAQLRVLVRGGVGSTLSVFRSPGRSAGPLATFPVVTGEETFLVPVEIGDGWYRAEVRAPGDPSGIGADPTLPDQLRAATSPIFISTTAFAAPVPEIPLPDNASGDDRARLALGGERGFTGFADVAVAGDVTHLVAESHRHGRVSVVYKRIAGAHRDEVELSARTGRAPRVAASGRDVWVVWQEEVSDRPRRSEIHLRHSTNGGRHFGPAVRLSRGAGRSLHPAIALDGNRPVVAWADNAGGPFDVHVQVVGADSDPVAVSAPGKTTDPGTPADARSARFPASLFPTVAAAPDGTILVAWQDNRFDPDPLWTGHTPPPGQPPSGGTDPDSWDILAALRRPGQPAWSAPAPVSADPAAADRHPSAAAGPSGFVIMWETKELRSSGANLSLRASRFTGSSWTPAEPVALDPSAMSQHPRLGLDPDRTVRAVWYDSRSADWRWKVFTATLDTSSGWSAPTQLSIAGNSTWPAVDGGTVAFTSDRRSPRIQRDLTHQIYLINLVLGPGDIEGIEPVAVPG